MSPINSSLRQASVKERAAARQAGVTLIEIMIVLAIIGLIMGVLVGPAVVGSLEKARIDTAYTMTQTISGAYSKWTASTGEACPSSIDDLKEDMGKSKSSTVKDPWSQDYIIKCGDGLPEGCDTTICVYSKGPDKQDGTKDDIKGWMDRPKK
jgi:general secretion pathway protein G